MAVNPEQAQDSIIFGQFAGLKNTVAETRLAPEDLARALNIDIDDAAQARRRRGYTKKIDGSFHSVAAVGSRTFAVMDGNLVRLYPDYTTKLIQYDVGDAPLAYVAVGDTVYFSSSVISGKIGPDDSSSPWGALVSEGEWLSPVVVPTDTLPDLDGKLLGKPPLATSLALFNGRIYLASGRTLWATELYLYDYVDKTRNFIQFESDITAVFDVDDGLYVCTEDEVWFLTGPFAQMQRVQASPQGALAGSVVRVPSTALTLEQPTRGDVAIFMSRSGVCVGLPSGVCYSLTQPKFDFPQGESAAAMFRHQDGVSQYVGVIDSAGGPKSTARFGDYVDAEIRRFEGV